MSLLEAHMALLGQMGDRLRYLRPGMTALMEALAENERFADLRYPAHCAALLRTGNSFSYSWQTALAQEKNRLGREETEILAGLAEVLGQSDMDGQLAALAYTEKMLQSRWEPARTQEQKYAGLYRSMGLFLGLAAAVVLL